MLLQARKVITASDAVRMVRFVRSGAVEAVAQEGFLDHWARRLHPSEAEDCRLGSRRAVSLWLRPMALAAVKRSKNDHAERASTGLQGGQVEGAPC